MSDFDPDWPHGHVTRDGRKARIICRDRKREFPVVALIERAGEERISVHYSDGRCAPCASTTDDLINAPAPKRKLEAWATFYERKDGSVFVGSAWGAREAADNAAARTTSCKRIACLHVVGEEGDGL